VTAAGDRFALVGGWGRYAIVAREWAGGRPEHDHLTRNFDRQVAWCECGARRPVVEYLGGRSLAMAERALRRLEGSPRPPKIG
jgi:hypothetical protein